jgi:hypothetical protein
MVIGPLPVFDELLPLLLLLLQAATTIAAAAVTAVRDKNRVR